MVLDIDGAMQQAPQPERHFMHILGGSAVTQAEPAERS